MFCHCHDIFISIMNNKIHREDISGKRFGKLLVTTPFDKKNRTWRWTCICDCGNKTIAYVSKLKNGCKTSCGCGKYENIKPKYGKEHHGWTGYEEIYGSYWKQLQASAKERNIKFQLTIEYAWNLFLEQNRKCALSGIELKFPKQQREKSKFKNKPSLDRIDSSKGYIKGNVQWVDTRINYMKLDHDQSEFLELCKLITEHRKAVQHEFTVGQNISQYCEGNV